MTPPAKKAPEPEVITRPTFEGTPHKSAKAANAARAQAAEDRGVELDDVPELGEVELAVMYDVAGSIDGQEGRYPTEAGAKSAVKNLKAQASSDDWQGPVPAWTIDRVEVDVAAINDHAELVAGEED
jgi:hypothetical protein